MIDIARSAGSACKFPGSGGAIVGMCDEKKLTQLRQAFESRGFVFVRLTPFAPSQASLSNVVFFGPCRVWFSPMYYMCDDWMLCYWIGLILDRKIVCRVSTSVQLQ